MRDRWTPGELTGRWKGRQAGEQGDSRADRETGKQVRRGQMEAVREWPGGKGARRGGRGGSTERGEFRYPTFPGRPRTQPHHEAQHLLVPVCCG